MFCFSKPSRDSIQAFLAAQRSQQFSYLEIGASREQAPNGYTADHNRIQLGRGASAFERAKIALRNWKMFDIPWIDLCWPSTPIQAGATVGVLVSHLGFWSLNACRIVYVIEDNSNSGTYAPASPMALCMAMGKSERNASPLSIEVPTNPCGTTCTRSPGQARWCAWLILSRGPFRSVLREIQKLPCSELCNRSRFLGASESQITTKSYASRRPCGILLLKTV